MAVTRQAPVWLFSDARYVGGAELYLESILRGAEPGQVALLALQADASTPTTPWLDRLESDGIAVERLAATTTLEARGKLHRWLMRRRPRVVHVNLPGPYDGLLATAPAIAKWAGVRRVLCTEHLPGVGRVGKRYWLKRTLVGSVDRVIALCAVHRELLQREFGYAAERIVVIANGVVDQGGCAVRQTLPADVAGWEREVSALRLVQLAALEERKGGESLLLALAQLKQRGITTQLWFVGEGAARAHWTSRARELGLGESVHFAGQRPDARQFLAAADVVVLASRREGMPLSLLEAMEVGRPIVASAVDGVPEMLAEEAGVLVAADDVGELATALADLAGNAARRAQLAQRARQRFLAHYRREDMLARTFALYGEML